MNHAPAAALLALTALLSTSPASGQGVQIGAGTYERQSSAVFFYSKTPSSFDVFGQCEVTYGAPRWQAAHAGLIADAAAGTRLRLGKDGWTVLDTNVPLRAGAVTIPAGIHYLALEAAGEGALRLLVLDAAKVQKRKLYATLTDKTEGGLAIPLRSIDPPAEGHEPVERLSITWARSRADAAAVELVLRWGDQHRRATLTPVLDGTKAG